MQAPEHEQAEMTGCSRQRRTSNFQRNVSISLAVAGTFGDT